MFEIDGTTITLTRGDSLLVKIIINLKDENNVIIGEYTPDPDDEISFALKHPQLKSDKSDFVDEEPLILKVIPNDTQLLKLDPEDTKGLAFGDYKYDIEIKFKDGFVRTFIPDARFKITKEVH